MPDATGPFTGRLGFGRSSALVVIDMVRAYTDPQYPLYIGPHAPEVVAAVVTLVDAARAANIPIVYTGVRYQPGGADGGVFFRKVPPLELFVGESDAGSLVRELAPLPGEPLILKQYASAFWSTPVASMLHALGVDTVILAGVSTSGCIRASATDAMQQGFIPVVVREAVGDRNVGPHEANLFDIAAKIGDVVSLDEAIAHLGSIG
jgi:nicotinamidase-related amidase